MQDENARQYGNHRGNIAENIGAGGRKMLQGIIDEQISDHRGKHPQIADGKHHFPVGKGFRHEGGGVAAVLDQGKDEEEKEAHDEHDVGEIKGGIISGKLSAEQGIKRAAEIGPQQAETAAHGILPARRPQRNHEHPGNGKGNAQPLFGRELFPEQHGPQNGGENGADGSDDAGKRSSGIFEAVIFHDEIENGLQNTQHDGPKQLFPLELQFHDPEGNQQLHNQNGQPKTQGEQDHGLHDIQGDLGKKITEAKDGKGCSGGQHAFLFAGQSAFLLCLETGKAYHNG